MSPIELRTMVAAQIAAGMLRDVPPNTSESGLKSFAEHVVKLAKAIEEAAAKSVRS
jgi:hypothetical protein